MLADVATGLVEIAADDGMGVLVAPRPAVGLDELELALDPVRLGVDQRAVHVPQDGGGAAAGTVGPPGGWSCAARGYSVQPVSTVHAVRYHRHVVAVGILIMLVGFALVVPRGGMPGSTSARNVTLGSQRVFSRRGDQGLPSRRYRVIQVIVGLVLLVVGILVIAVSG